MPRKSTILIAAFSLVYIAVRLSRLTDSCLWFDEIFSIHAAEHPWGEIIPFIAKDLIHPPLFYVVLKLWTAAGGESLFWLRLLPVVCSVLAPYPLWMLCRELKLRQGTIVVVFGLFAVNGALIKYAQEVRMYSLLLFLSLMSIWLFSRYYFRGKSFWMLVIVNVLLVYTHYFGWFVVLSEVLVIVVAQRIKILRTLLMLAVTAAAFVPWVIALFRFAEPGSSVEQNIGWMQSPGIRQIIELMFDLVDPFYFQQSSIDLAANYPVAVPVVLLIFAAAVVYLLDFRNEPNKDRIYFLAVLAAFPVLAVFLLSWLMPVSIWGSRHLLIVFPPVLVLTAILLTDIKPDILRYCLPAGLFVFATAGFIMQLRIEPPRHIWCAWEGFAGEWVLAGQNSSRPRRLYVFEDLVAYHYWFAVRTRANYEVKLVKGVEGVPNDPAYFLPRGFDGVLISDLSDINEDEIWISFREQRKPRPQGSLNDSFEEMRFEVPVTNLENLGYTVEDVKKQIYGRQIAYLIKMRKSPPGSGPKE